MDKVTYDSGASLEAISEAQRRNAIDGIPRHVDNTNKIIKYDWALHEDVPNNIFGETLEEHIAKLLEQVKHGQD